MFRCVVTCCAICVTALAGCNHEAAPPQKPANPTVTVSIPLQQDITDDAFYTGRTAAIENVQIRARVSGYLADIHFKDGTEVDKDAVLFDIDPRPYKDAVAKAEANIAMQEAELKYNKAVYERDVALLKRKAIALEEVQLGKSKYSVSEANVESAKANAAQARLNLEWTKVQAPISGRLSRTFVTRGNLVTADQTILTTLVSQDPMYAYFDVDEPTVQQVQDLIRAGKFEQKKDKSVHWPVYLGLAAEQGYPHEGYIDFSNNEVSAGTATLQVRGVFTNPNPQIGPRVLSPGQFVRVRVPVSPRYPALLVVEDAVQTDQDLKFLYVVDDQNKVARRDVKLGSPHEGLRVIKEGLKAGEHVVVNGLQHIKAGVEVQAKLVPMPVPSPNPAAQIAPP